MRDAEELWGGPSGDRESEGESRGCDCAGGLLKSWRRYLGQLGRPNLGSFPPPPRFCWKGKGREMDVY